MNTTTGICNCLVKNTTQLLQKEEDKRSSEALFHQLAFLLGLVYLTAFSSFAYMWFAPPKQHPKKVTRIPTIPFATGHFIELSKDYLTPDARILVDPMEKNGNWCTNKLNAIMRMIFGIDKEENYSVPWNTRMLSIKMEGFIHGQRFHDFEPIDGAAPGSYFTYQMYSTNVWGNWIQVTRYVERGVSYIAGFCIHIPDGTLCSVDLNLVKTFWNSEKYPGRIRGVEECEHILNEPVSIEIQKNMQAKYCPRLQEFMVTWEEDGVVMHQEWKEEFREMKKEEKVCGVCTELLNDPLI